MNLASQWLARGVSKLRTTESTAASAKAPAPAAANAPVPAAAKAVAPRTTHARLKATLRRGEEVLAPRVLRRLMEDLQAASAAQVSEIEGGRRARDVIDWYKTASVPERQDLWSLLCEQFGPDAQGLQRARQRYDEATSEEDRGQAEIALRRALTSARTRLLQRFAVPAGGMRFLLDLRAELLALPKSDKRFVALDAELEHLFSTWFDVAFLELQRLSWDSPASLLEKLIQYEAVHDIRSWADLKNRLDSDRRCYGFFHPRLPGEPLIFVEVALVDSLSDSITPLLDESAATADISRASTAIFYSISSTQTGLRGVSFGDSLIKHVAQTLGAEFPRLRTFATLSPIPGLRAWLAKNGTALLAKMEDKQRGELARALGLGPKEPLEASALLAAAEQPAQLPAQSPVRRALLWCAAHYLGKESHNGRPLDPVARFHLGNGARVERLNWAGDPSVKGAKQSFGLMVNYLYDLKKIDKHRDLLAQGRMPVSRDIESLMKG